MTNDRILSRRCAQAIPAVTRVIRRVRDRGATCGALAPTRKPTAATQAIGTDEYAISTNAVSPTTLTAEQTNRTRRCPYLSANAPVAGPKIAVPIPITADTTPLWAIEPRTSEISVRAPTTVMANGSRLTNASGKKPQPTRSSRERNPDGAAAPRAASAAGGASWGDADWSCAAVFGEEVLKSSSLSACQADGSSGGLACRSCPPGRA